MGCDIHLYIEVRKDGKWEPTTDESFTPDRDYRLFGALAGVRAYTVEPIDMPRGLPADVSAVVKADSDSWQGNGHSHSWLLISEILNHQCDQEMRERLLDFLSEDIYWHDSGDSEITRIVFWFDN